MSGVDIAIIAVVAALFVAALGYLVYRKVKGKSGCDCGGDCGGNCAHCGGASGGCGKDKSDAHKNTDASTCPHCAKSDISTENRSEI